MGFHRIDMRAALAELNRQYGVGTVRVDSGGMLNSVLLQSGVVDEVSILIHPFLAGGSQNPALFDPEKAGFTGLLVLLHLWHTEVLDKGIIWARYSVAKP